MSDQRSRGLARGMFDDVDLLIASTQLKYAKREKAH